MGLFITMEGPDGSGKSTQIELLRDYLSGKGYDIIICREPGGTKISEAICQVILNKDFTEMGNMTEMLLYAAARAQLVEEVIRPALRMIKLSYVTVLWNLLQSIRELPEVWGLNWYMRSINMQLEIQCRI